MKESRFFMMRDTKGSIVFVEEGQMCGIGEMPGRSILIISIKQWSDEVDFDRFKLMASDKKVFRSCFRRECRSSSGLPGLNIMVC